VSDLTKAKAGYDGWVERMCPAYDWGSEVTTYVGALEAEVERLTALLADANKRAEKNFVTNLNTELMDLSGRQVNRIADLENALRFSLGQNDDLRARIPDPDDLRTVLSMADAHIDGLVRAKRHPDPYAQASRMQVVGDGHNTIAPLRAALPGEEGTT